MDIIQVTQLIMTRLNRLVQNITTVLVASGGVFSGYYFYWDSSNNTWNDAAAGDGQADPVSFSYSATPVVNGTIITGIGGQGADFIFTMSGIVSSSTPPTPEATIYPTSGAWNNQHYFVYRGDIVENGTTYFHYSLDFQPGNTIGGYSILYDYTNKIWKDGDDASPFYLHSSVPLVGTSFTITNPAHLHGFDTNSTEYFGFPNPYYEAPAYRTGTSQAFSLNVVQALGRMKDTLCL